MKIFKNMHNYAWPLIIWWKRNFQLKHLNFRDCLVYIVWYLVSRFIFPFLCSDFNLKATVVKTDEIRGLKLFFTPYFLVIGKENFFQNNCHLLMYSQKRSLQDYVTKLCNNQIFKTLLWIKKSFKSIYFDLAKHALVSNVNHC